VALFLTVALLAGLSASSPALADSNGLRDPFAPRVVVSEGATQSGRLVDPFTRPRPLSVARASTELRDPFAAPVRDYGLRDPFESRSPVARLAAASSADSELVDPFEVRRAERASSSGTSVLRDPFAQE
jgi:hypothetical protein